MNAFYDVTGDDCFDNTAVVHTRITHDQSLQRVAAISCEIAFHLTTFYRQDCTRTPVGLVRLLSVLNVFFSPCRGGTLHQLIM